MSVQIREHKPAEQLAPYVELFWEGDFNTTYEYKLRQQVVPNGYVELVIHLSERHCDLFKGNRWLRSPDYTVIGLYTRPYEVHFRDRVRVFGIRFKPEGIYNLFGIPASEFSESYEDMSLVLGAAFREYCSRLRESEKISQKLLLTQHYLVSQLKKNHSELTYVNRAAELIRKSDRFDKIDRLPEQVYISLRQLEREFKKKIGITPKRYMRISRLNEVHRKLEEKKEIEFTKIAFDCGYSDQAHFIRDFKSFMGVKPTIFIKEKNRFIVNPESANTLREQSV